MVELHATRRELLTGFGVAAATGLAGCAGGSGDGGGDTPSIGTARLSTGSTSLIAPIITEKGWDKENGFSLETKVRNSVSAYYGDFVSGTYRTLPFGISSAASRYNKGVDLKLFAGFDYSSMFWLTNSEEISTIADFEGKTVSAPLGSGSFQVANAVAKQETGKSIEDLAGNLINASGPANPLKEIATGNADVGLSWEPALSTFLVKNDSDVHTIVDVRKQYKKYFGAESFHLAWAVKGSVLEENRDALRGLVTANQRVGDLYANDVDEALDVIVGTTENERSSLAEALKSGRQEFSLKPLGELQSAVKTQFEVFADLGIIDSVPDDGIYADIQPK